jgi:hypothetical protein
MGRRGQIRQRERRFAIVDSRLAICELTERNLRFRPPLTVPYRLFPSLSVGEMKRGGAMTGLGLEPRTYGLKVTAEGAPQSVIEWCLAPESGE